MSSVGPYTVLRYLRFASGLGIGEPEPGELDYGTGLRHVGKLPGTTEFDDSMSIISRAASTFEEEDDGEMSHKETIHSSTASINEDDGAVYNYGRISDKVGEACACFLARWGQEIFATEEAAMEHGGSLDQTLLPQAPRIWARGGLTASWVRALLSSDDFFVANERERYNFARRVVELRRSAGIQPSEEAEWTVLFHEGIYYSNISFDELVLMSRDVSPTTRVAYVPLAVLHGAHWAQSQLRSQVLARPGALTFAQSLQGSPGDSPSPQPRDRDLALTVTTQQLATQQAGEQLPQDEPMFFFPVMSDGSERVGSPAANDAILRDPNHHGQHSTTPRTGFSRDFFGLRFSKHTQTAALATDPNQTRPSARWSTHPPFRFGVEFWNVTELDQKVFSQTIWYGGSLFNVYAQLVRKKGIQLGVYLHRQSSVEAIPRPISPPSSIRPLPASMAADIASPRPEAWSGAHPARNLPSHNSRPSLGNIAATSSSASGSGMRHRASSSVGTLATPTTPLRTTTPRPVSPAPPRSPRYPSGALPIASTSPPPVETGSSSYGTPPRLAMSLQIRKSPLSCLVNTTLMLFTAHPPAPLQPYRDPRPAVQVYFGINCFVHPAALIRFTSAPDAFTPSQSWGWSSNKLVLPSVSEGDNVRPSSLRATVIVGLV